MSPLFEEKYRYIVFEPVDSVLAQLKSILKTPWYDIAVNLAGKVSSDNTFKLYPKFSIGVEVFGVIQSVAVLTGRLEPTDGQTHILVEVRPNYALLFVFYLILLILLLKVLGMFISRTSDDWILSVALFFMLIFIRSLMHFSIGRLKNRFERTMSVHPED
jgi:hypothetical protein